MAQSITLQTSDSDIISSDVLGRLSFAASSESSGSDAVLIGASIYAMAESNFTEISNATSIIFATASSESAIAKLKISSQGHFLPILDKTYDIGASGTKFRNVFAENGKFENISISNLSDPYEILYITDSSGNVSSTDLLKVDVANTEIDLGGDLIPTSNLAYDLGSSSYKFRDTYTDKVILNSGSAIPATTSNTVYNVSGELYYNNNVVALLPSGGVQGQILQKYSTTSNILEWIDNFATEVRVYVKNTTGSALTKGQAVYINGAQGNHPTIALAIANGESSSSKTLGLLKQNLAINEFGYVIAEGALDGIDTSAASAAGDLIYLSPTTAGGVVYGLANKPTAPNHMVFIGYVVVKQQNNGKVFIKVQNGFELEELHNVAVTGATNGQFLQYNSSSDLWIPSSSGNFTTLQLNGTTVSVSGHTHTSSNITDWNEAVDDRVNSLLVAGSGINLNYNDSNNTLTINLASSAVSGYEILSSGKSIFTVSQGYLSNNLNVYVNGSKLILGEDYTASNGSTFTLTQTAASGDIIEWQGLGGPAAYSELNHTHSSSDITNFNSSVSGLLPTIANSGDNRILTSTGSSVGINAESNLTFDGSTLGIIGNVGAGTSSPTQRLQVHGSSGDDVYLRISNTDTTTASGLLIGLMGTEDAVIRVEPNKALTFGTNNSERMRIDSAGKVGIGSASTAATYGGLLRIGPMSSSSLLSDGGLEFVNAASSNGWGWRIANLDAGAGSVPLVFQNRSNSTSWSEILRITEGGNVGIGTSSPSVKLDVYGADAAISVGTSSYGRFQTSGGNAIGYMYGSFAALGDGIHLTYNHYHNAAGTLVISNSAGFTSRITAGYGAVMFATSSAANVAPTERMRITSDGNVGIGTTSVSSGFRIDIRGRLLSYTTASDGLITVQGLQTESSGTGKSAIQIDVNGKGGFAWQNDASSGTRALRLLENSGYGAGDTTALLYSGGAFTFNRRVDITQGTTTGAQAHCYVRPENGGLGRDSQITFGCTFSNGWGGADFAARDAGAIRFGANGGSADPRDWSMRFLVANGPAGSDTPRECMRITAAGNVGIGVTTNLTAALNFPQADSGEVINYYPSATEGVRSGVGKYSAEVRHYVPAGDVFTWRTGGPSGTERMKLSASLLTVGSSVSITASQVYSDIVGATNRDLFVDSTGKFGYVSSIRASKTNIAAIDDVSWLRDLTPVSFFYRRRNEDGTYSDEPDGTLDYGLIAEDVEVVAPELCFYDIIDDNPELRGVHYSKLITPMLKYIQQLEDRIASLETRLGDNV